MHLEQPPAACHNSGKRQEDVSVAGRLLEHEEEACAQPLRRVELDAKRARDPVGHRKPIRGTSVSRYGSSSSTAITSVAVACERAARRDRRRSRARRGTSRPRGPSATSRHASIARSTARREIARPAFVRTSRSRSGSRSSSAKTCSAPKWSTIARANVGPIPGTRRRSQSATPSAVCGSTERKDSTENCQP